VEQKRILIVDDEPGVAFFLREGLQGLGEEYDVRTTRSAESALEWFHNQSFDLAVIDYRLPGLSGLDLMRRLRDICPQMQTIMITAYSSPDLEDAAHQLRVRRYFAKPFHIEELMRSVRELLSPPPLSRF
jgi:DNA-binding NtrC family response regulator